MTSCVSRSGYYRPATAKGSVSDGKEDILEDRCGCQRMHRGVIGQRFLADVLMLPDESDSPPGVRNWRQDAGFERVF